MVKTFHEKTEAIIAAWEEAPTDQARRLRQLERELRHGRRAALFEGRPAYPTAWDRANLARRLGWLPTDDEWRGVGVETEVGDGSSKER